MDDQTMTMRAGEVTEPRRIVEFELHRPRREDVKLPRLDAEPIRKAIEQVALTSIGLAIITARSVAGTLEAAHKAGAEAAEHPGPVTRVVLDVVGHKGAKPQPLTRHSIPVLPIADYDTLDSEQVIARLTNLDRELLEAVRTYELEHERRTAILKAIDGLLTTV